MTGSAYALVVLFAINLMNFFDRQIIGGVGEGIRREWALTDTALGLLGTVFTLLYAVVGLPLGRLSDRKQRRKILAAGVFVWSLLTAASGVARNFAQLIVARLGVGVGEATCSPASTSLIGDLVPVTARARAVAIWMLGLPLGLGLANGSGGWILQNWGWRKAFYVAAVPGLLCAGAALFMAEPHRGTQESHAVGDQRRAGNPYLLVLSIPTMWWVIVSGALHNFNMYALGAFVAPFLARYHHMSFVNAGWVAACVYGFSGVVGLTGGGWLADRLVTRRVDGRLIVGTAAIVVCTPFMLLGLNRPAGDIVAFSLLMGTGVGVMFAYYSTVYATIHDVVEPSLRGTAMALYFFAMYVLGASMGPVGTGLASDYFTFQKASAAGAVAPLSFGELMAAELRSLVGEAKGFNLRALEPFRADGLHTAMYIVPILAAVLAVVLFAASRTVAKDVAKLQGWMRSHGAAVKAS
ncbi:MAG TPA: MFS transporter [Vicinamibacterales bacterium]|nr:MFS transporter [Vicinamibacterales bacterium]